MIDGNFGTAAAPTVSSAGDNRPLSWPTADRLKIYFAYGLVIDVVFLVVYGGANWLTAQRPSPWHMYWDWELSIPFVPAMIWAYGSMFILFFLPLFQLRPQELPALGKQVLLATAAAGVVFLLLPGELGYPRVGDSGEFGAAFAFIYAVDFPHNLVPSLHIVYSALIVFSLTDVSGPRLRLFYGAWLALLALSVVLVHQHHVADVASGFALVWLCRRLIRPPAKER